MKTFNDLVFVDEVMYGDKVWSRSYMIFDNGYGISVIQGPHSYGGKLGLYELAVLKHDDIHYDNPVAGGDVRGFLSEDAVTELLIQIQKL